MVLLRKFSLSAVGDFVTQAVGLKGISGTA
jgi:hypothetical protein